MVAEKQESMFPCYNGYYATPRIISLINCDWLCEPVFANTRFKTVRTVWIEIPDALA